MGNESGSLLDLSMQIISPRIVSSYMIVGNGKPIERQMDRREKLCEKLFREIEENEDHKLHGLLPEMNKAVHIFKLKQLGNIISQRFIYLFINFAAKNLYNNNGAGTSTQREPITLMPWFYRQY